MPKSNLERYGHLQQTEECFKSWAASMDVCARLKAQVCVVQLPPSFDRTDDHAQAVIDFFQKVERRVKVGIEFRHKSWRGDPQPVASILRRVRLLHITDPLVEDPALHSDIQYFRLHGLVSRLYSYTYTDRDLDELNRTVSRLKASECYVMFTT